MKPDEIDELIRRAEAGEQIMVKVGYGQARPADLDDLHLARALAVHLDDLASKTSELVEQAAARLDLELCPPDAAERAGFAKPPERVTVTGVFKHRTPCLRC